MLLSITFVFLSKDSVALSNQATQADDNVEEESIKQAVQKSSNASADDARKKSNEKMRAASTIKVTNKNKEKMNCSRRRLRQSKEKQKSKHQKRKNIRESNYQSLLSRVSA
jgi:hypothetical protein